MSQPLLLKTNAEPTIFNKEMVIGTLLFPIVGTIIGGIVGKSRMEREKNEGKVVSETPSFWNKDTLLGGLLGGLVARLVVAVAVAVFAPQATAIGLGAMAGASLVGIVAGAYMGGKSGEKRQMAEYAQARQQAIVEHLSNNVSPEVGKAVEYTMTHNKSWAKDVTEAKMLADAQQGIRQP